MELLYAEYMREKKLLEFVRWFCNKKLITVLAIFIYSNSYSQQITWQKYLANVQLGNNGHGIVQLEDSGFAIAARNNFDLLLIRTDKFGDTLWTKNYLNQGIIGKLIKTKDSGFAI